MLFQKGQHTFAVIIYMISNKNQIVFGSDNMIPNTKSNCFDSNHVISRKVNIVLAMIIWFPKSQKWNSPGICLVPQLHNCGDGNGVEYKWNQNEICLTELENTKLKCLAFRQGGNWRKTNFQNSACLFQNTPNKVWLYFSLLFISLL